MAIMPLLQLGLAEQIRSLASTTTTVSPTYALPARQCSLAWQYSFSTNPSAVVMNAQVSLDNVTFVTIDSTTGTTGGLRLVTGLAANFFRLNVGSITGGAELNAFVTAKAM